MEALLEGFQGLNEGYFFEIISVSTLINNNMHIMDMKISSMEINTGLLCCKE